MTIWNQNALKTSITSAMDQLKLNQLVTRYNFSVNFIPAENTAEISLVVEPAWELRLIKVNISISF
jgi:hypothetical protein